YWDVDVATSTGTSHGGEGKTTAEMMSQSTFANWDFTNVWQIDEGESYPYHAWQGGGGGTPIIVSNPQSPIPNPQKPLYYNIKGNPLGTTKPTTPGVYIERQSKQAKRIVVR
ncbi:MAG: hypothetical protein LBU89_04750, partial [Fibromonadaceae bacterium]|nr:hypothetical protein [Fibromonadaceae bacterium]